MSSPVSTTAEYDPLRVYLAGLPQDQFSVEMTFSELETILGFRLPERALKYDWWRIDERGPTSPLARAFADAGFGVSSFAPNHSVSFFRGLQRWPGICIASREVGQLPVSERLRQLALGYLESAKTLCIQLGSNPSDLTWSRATVVCFCYRHAVELFLKACILHREPLKKCDHDISKLRQQYCQIYPHPQFDFETIYDISLEEIETLLGGRTDVEDFERKPDQVFRYLSDKDGRSPKGEYIFAPAGYLSIIERLEQDIARVWRTILGSTT